jgi:hypothetical protein
MDRRITDSGLFEDQGFDHFRNHFCPADIDHGLAPSKDADRSVWHLLSKVPGPMP